MSAQSEYRVIGTRPPRADATDKVTGRALFGPDVALPGTLYGKVLRSPHAHARIRSIDTRRAEALPGVYAVVTARDLAQPGEASFGSDNILAGSKVLFQGHGVAAVAASSVHIAEEALKLIAVDYEPLPAVPDVREAMREDAPLLHEGLRTCSLGADDDRSSNIADHTQSFLGDPDAGFAEAEIMVEREFSLSTVHQGYIEPHACTAHWGPEGQLSVWTCTQGAFVIRDQLAELFELPLSRIRVFPTEVGGAFGGKANVFLEPLAALLSRKTGKPVKMVMTRSEVFLGSGPTSGGTIRLKMGATRQGRITAAEADLRYEAGAYPGSPVGGAMYNLLAAYDIPNIRADAYDVLVNKPRTGSYRAPGCTQAAFAAEQVIDELAQKVGMDPIAFRRLNAAREGSQRIDGSVHSNIGAQQVLQAAQECAQMRTPLTGKYRGRGVAFAHWGNWGAVSSCTISVNADGSVNLLSGSVDLSGTRTTVAMQAAEILGLEIGQVKASVGDTDSIGFTEASGGSRTTFATGLVAAEAAREVIAKMRERAALLWGVPVETVSYDRVAFTSSENPGERLTFAELAGQLSDTGGPVTGVGSMDTQGWGVAFGCHIADVEVDPETGKVVVLRYTVVQDVGKAIHPTLVEGQMQGGAAQGIGWALYEGYQYDDRGRMLNPNLSDYKLPTTLDVPPIETVIVEVPGPNHPFGVRGVGEMPIVLPPAALANAIARAIGQRLEHLPMTPERILRAMGVI